MLINSLILTPGETTFCSSHGNLDNFLEWQVKLSLFKYTNISYSPKYRSSKLKLLICWEIPHIPLHKSSSKISNTEANCSWKKSSYELIINLHLKLKLFFLILKLSFLCPIRSWNNRFVPLKLLWLRDQQD